MKLHISIPGLETKRQSLIITKALTELINDQFPNSRLGHWKIWKGVTEMTLKMEIPNLISTAQGVLILEEVQKAVVAAFSGTAPGIQIPDWTFSYEEELIEISGKESTPFSRYLTGTTKEGTSHGN